MSDESLQNLVKIEQLKVEKFSRSEFDGLVKSARSRLADARNESLSPESRFDLAYNAAHGFALAALRIKGCRPNHARFVVFQTLEITAGLAPAIWRVLAKCHDNRNLAEYEGHSEIDERLLVELIRCATLLEAAIARLPLPSE